MTVKTSVKAGSQMGIRVNRCEILQKKALTSNVNTNLKG
jgi:hypothetical protein